jgi:lysophospholipase L1-like esterase
MRFRMHDLRRGVAAAAPWFVLAAGALAFLGGCTPHGGEGEPVKLSAIGDVPDSAWTQLAARRIYFGHQSVGSNIMQGVTDLVAADPKLGLRVLDSAPADSAGAFVHGDVGRNGEPARKTDDFARNLEDGSVGHPDIAFHKYCFADIVDTTNVEAVFAHYRDTMARLRAAHPSVVFVHVTSPLVRVQSGPVASLKLLLGRAPGRYPSNFKREAFNQLMRKEYAGREPLFDLAAVESTRPDGGRETIQLRGRTGYALFPGWTDDGSHLNAAGRKRAAEELLVLLARLPRP